jgi:dienelactone hydrolase
MRLDELLLSRGLRSWALRLSVCCVVASVATGCATAPGAKFSAPGAGIRSERVHFPGAGVKLDGEFFVPVRPGEQSVRRPAVVLLHGCSGMYTQRGALTERSRDWAARLTDWGFVALFVDSLGPRGLGSLCELKDRPIHPWRELTRDAYAALDYLVARADVDAAKVFVMGWSNGGSTVTGVVRANAPGLRAGGPRFTAAVAYYPGCARLLRDRSYRPTMPVLIQHGAADDWTPAAPCVELAEKLQREALPVTTISYPGAHHGFDAPNTKLRFLPNAYNPAAPGERGAHVGTHEPSRLKAIADTRRFIEQQLAK